MSVLEEFPHRLIRQIVTEGVEDENGFYHDEDYSFDEDNPISCRAVAAGKDNEIRFEDGTVKSYTYTVTMAPDVQYFKLGEKVMLTTYDRTCEYEVKGFHRYTYHAKIWV
jgi:hypothetical protein